ncbi:MAG TPA: restriction endonuclease subunit S, partial [Planctomycetaceae bacterium]|nr:restriction endonuclease subunit S [Planctomycetaceae bacterium]
MYGTSSDCNQEDEGTPVLRIPNIKDGYVDFTDLKYANFSTEDEDRYILSENDILVVRTNGNPQLVGKSAIFTSQCKCIFASYLIKIQPRPNVVPAYLNLVMNASCTREMLTLSARTSAGNYNMNC